MKRKSEIASVNGENLNLYFPIDPSDSKQRPPTDAASIIIPQAVPR